jgi:hypothetical protein
MSNPTSNFNWQMPTNTDLVSQLPADFEVFGQAVDTSLADLKGGTTGQVLAKASNADMDFVWSADAAGMTNPMTTTGDTIYSSSGSTPARLGIGSTGNVLTVAGGVPTWAAPATGGGMTLLSTTTLSGTSTTISGISQDYVNLFILFDRVTQNTTGGYLRMNLGAGTFSQYNSAKESAGTSFVNSGAVLFITPFGTNTPNSGYEIFGQATIFNYASSLTNNGKSVLCSGASFSGAGSFGPTFNVGYLDSVPALSSIKFDYSNGGTISGTIKIYGVK